MQFYISAAQNCRNKHTHTDTDRLALLMRGAEPSFESVLKKNHRASETNKKVAIFNLPFHPEMHCSCREHVEKTARTENEIRSVFSSVLFFPSAFFSDAESQKRTSINRCCTSDLILPITSAPCCWNGSHLFSDFGVFFCVALSFVFVPDFCMFSINFCTFFWRTRDEIWLQSELRYRASA